jgi:hemerythrin-like domain-containing protein
LQIKLFYIDIKRINRLSRLNIDGFDKEYSMADRNVHYNRRKFIEQTFVAGSVTGIAGLTLFTGCRDDSADKTYPAEDLMREHGVLNRILLIYDSCKARLVTGEPFPLEALHNGGELIRTFIEEYHEKLEEGFLFPRFQKANQLADLVKILLEQHVSGRKITQQIIGISRFKTLSGNEPLILINILTSFCQMYRPHAAREDTILFPAFKKIVSTEEYHSLGDNFEMKEDELFGKEGFESVVEKVAGLEKQLDIFDLSKFTSDL